MSERAPGARGDQIRFIGTATTLIAFDGFTVLTDPNFLHRGERARLGMGLRSRRLTEPAMTIAELPPLDAIVLSHHHGDHFDDRAARDLDRDVPIVTTHHATAKLRRQGFRRPIPLRTWRRTTFVKGGATLTVTATPAIHARGPLAAVLPPVIGSVLEFARDAQTRLRIYVTGDTLLDRALAEIPARFGELDVCLLHLGGTRIAGVLLTMDAARGVEALRMVAPRRAVPIHYDDYTVFSSPLSDFRAAVARSGLGTEVTYLDRGEALPLAFPQDLRRGA